MEDTSFSTRERTVGSAKRKREEGADGNKSKMEIQVGITNHQ